MTSYADSLTNATNSTEKSNSASVTDKNLYHIPNIIEAFLISVVIIAIITWVTKKMIRKARLALFPSQNGDNHHYKGSFWDIIREGDYRPSLSRFQFLVWTVAISFAIISIFLIRYMGGVPPFPTGNSFLLSDNLLELMGISTATPVISNVISKIKYDRSVGSTLPHNTLMKKNPFSTMLLEGNKPTLARYQMFLWTWISVIFFLVVFFSNTFGIIEKIEDTNKDIIKNMETANKNPTIKINPLENLSVPDIDSKLVLLMGLSQGGYLGAKYVARPILQVTGFILDKDSKLITIFGESFGEEQGIVKLRIDSSETTLTIKEKGWSDTRIDIEPSPEKFEKGQIVIITNDGLDVSQGYESELQL